MAIDNARAQVAKAINCDPNEVYFTGGGSEADNWAIKGIATAHMKKGNHIITTKIEHHAVLHTCEFLEKFGFEVTYLDVNEEGFVDLKQLEEAITDKTILVSIMFANNEIGTIQPIKEIGALCREKKVLFHTDAVQAVGSVPVDVKEMNIDLLSLAGHKLYGPKGIGALYIRRGIRIDNLIHGGGQERGRRAGVAVDHLIARLRRGVGSGYHLQSIGHIAHTELLHFTGVDRIGYSEVLASSNMCWCRYRYMLRLGFLCQAQHHEYHQCVPFYLLHNEMMFAYCFTSSCRTACVVADSSLSAFSAWWPSPAARLH